MITKSHNYLTTSLCPLTLSPMKSDQAQPGVSVDPMRRTPQLACPLPNRGSRPTPPCSPASHSLFHSALRLFWRSATLRSFLYFILLPSALGLSSVSAVIIGSPTRLSFLPAPFSIAMDLCENLNYPLQNLNYPLQILNYPLQILDYPLQKRLRPVFGNGLSPCSGLLNAEARLLRLSLSVRQGAGMVGVVTPRLPIPLAGARSSRLATESAPRNVEPIVNESRTGGFTQGTERAEAAQSSNRRHPMVQSPRRFDKTGSWAWESWCQ